MRAVVISEHSGFQLVSYGRGTAYCLTETETELSVFFQGDDAQIFREEMGAFEEHNPHGNALEYLWGLYSEVATKEEE